MAEIGTVSGVRDDLSGGAVHRRAGDAGLCRGDSGKLGLEDRVVNSLHLLRHMAHSHCAGHIRAVAAEFAAEVHGDELPGLNGLLTGNAVGQAAVGPRDHDGIKGLVLRAVVQHFIEQQRGNFLFRNAGTDLAENVRQRFFRDPLSLDHTIQLRLILDGTQRPQKLRDGDQLAVELLRKAAEIRRRHIFILIPHASDVFLFDDLVDEGGVGMFPVRLPDLRIPYMAGCGLRIPAVGEIIVVVSSDDGHTVRPGGVKAGGVKAVGLTSQQHSVQAVGLQHTGDFFEMIHSRSSFSESRGISGVTGPL